MSAVVCGKRSNNIFEESSSPAVSKRIRCYFSPIDHLLALFPDMDTQDVEKVLEESGVDLDSAIKRLNELRLSAAASTSFVTQESDVQFSVQGTIVNNGGTATGEEPPEESNLPVDGSGWVDLLVREVSSASDMNDARGRVSRALEALEKSICARASAEATQSFEKGNIMLRQQLEALIQENTILKRAVSIQHERQKEYEEMGQELHQLKQLVSQYQEQLRTLEVNNYALAMHLKQAQQNNSISGRFNPDVF